MMKKLTLLIVLLFTLMPVFVSAKQPAIKHVIYITLDGTRWQDVLVTKKDFPVFWKKYASSMKIYGMPGSETVMEVASVPISLPSYQSQMTGAVQACGGNECGQVKAQTLPEYLVASKKFRKQDVAVFSGWPVIGEALESKKGTVYNNVGNLAVVDPLTGKPDAVMAEINHKQTLRHHVETNRVDRYTFAQAEHYFQKYQPAFMWISLVNADNEAHMNHQRKYHHVLSSYDHYLDRLFTMLKHMKLDKNTMVVITTDHGRGNGQHWVEHGLELPESKTTWAIVMNGDLQPVKIEGNKKYYNTLSIRPAIEKALLN